MSFTGGDGKRKAREGKVVEIKETSLNERAGKEEEGYKRKGKKRQRNEENIYVADAVVYMVFFVSETFRTPEPLQA